jgi:O-antigen ligase
MIEKGTAMDSIKNSSDYRSTLFSEALKEWKDEPRVLLFGRSVYTPLDYTELKRVVGDKESFLMVNINSGTCHALIPSVLIQYGIFGGILYYLVYCGMFWYFFRSYQVAKREGYSEELQIISFVVALSTGLGIITDSIGGSWFGAFHILMVILIKSLAARDEQAYFVAQKLEEKGVAI